MESIYKDHFLEIEISPQTRGAIEPNTTYWTMDYKTGKKSIHFLQNGNHFPLTHIKNLIIGFDFVRDLEERTRIIYELEDGSVTVENEDEGRISFILPSYRYEYSGEILIYIYLIFENGQKLDCAMIRTHFQESWLDQELPEMEEFYVKRFEDLAKELKSRLNETNQAINHAQNKINSIQDQINANHVVTQTEFNNLPVRRRIQVTDWDTLDNTILGLRHGESVMVYASTESLNAPWGGINSLSGIAYLTSNNNDHIAIVVYRSSNVILRDRRAMRFRGSNGWGEWKYEAQPSTIAPLPNANTAQIGTSDQFARADHAHPPDPTRLPLTGGTLIGDLTSSGRIQSNHVDGLLVGNPSNINETMTFNFVNNNPRIRFYNLASNTPFQIQSGSNFVRFSATNTHAEVPGTFTAGGNMTAPRFIGNADTASRLQNARNFQLIGAIEGVTSSDLSNSVVINTTQRRIQITDFNNLPNPTTLGLELGEQIQVWGPSNASNAPELLAGSSSGGRLTRLAGTRFLLEVYTNHNRGWLWHYNNTAWEGPHQIPLQGEASVFNIRVDRANRLITPRTINDVAFDGTTNITVTANPTVTILGEGTNLNNVVTPGQYRCPANATVATMINVPVSRAFNLTVEFNGANGVGVIQTFKTFEGHTTHRQFVRTLPSGTTWGEWIEIPLATRSTRTYDMSVTRADQLAVPRSIVLNGDMSGNAWFDGSGDVNIRTTLDRRGWFNLTPLNGTTAHSESSIPQYCKIGDVVYLRGAFTNILGNGTTCAILPAGYRPVGQDQSFVQNTTVANNITYFARWTVKQNGEIELWRINRTDGYVAGNWFPIHTSFVIG